MLNNPILNLKDITREWYWVFGNAFAGYNEGIKQGH